MEKTKRNKRLTALVAGVSFMLLGYGCATTKNIKTTDMKRYDFDSLLINNKLDILELKSNQDRHGSWKYDIKEMVVYITEMQTKQEYKYLMQITPKNDYWELLQYYNELGVIISRGKFACNALTKVGEWEYFDENGEMTVVNEGAKYGNITYDDVIRILERKGVLDRKTGKNRDILSIYFSEEDGYIWRVDLADYKNQAYECFHIDKDTGKVLKHRKAKLLLM